MSDQKSGFTATQSVSRGTRWRPASVPSSPPPLNCTLHIHTQLPANFFFFCGRSAMLRPSVHMLPEARYPARRMLVNAREWRNNASWSSVAYTTSGSKARSNARWRGRSLAFKTRWRMCFSYKSFTFICFSCKLFLLFFCWQTKHV